MENPEISVIVPVYNVEKFLNQGLNSIINQTFKNIEIICINDGSTDNSLKILNTYAKRDKRIKIINQKNEGPSIARNNGMGIAKGKYICFIDSDDWVDKNYCKKLYTTAEKFNSDIVICKEKLYYQEQGKIKEHEFYIFPKIKSKKPITWKKIKKELFLTNPSVWGKIYKTDFLKKMGVKFPRGLWFEDNPFYFETTLSAKKIVFLKDSLYFYRKEVKNSITNSYEKKVLDILKICSISKDILNKHKIYNEVEKEFLDWMVERYFLTLYRGINQKYQKAAFYQFKKYLLKQKINKKNLLGKTKEAYNFFMGSFPLDKSKKISFLIDKIIGQIGLFIKRYNPKIYYYLGGKN
jgi:glycosyltransferase involved in cell wall biosynthesis